MLANANPTSVVINGSAVASGDFTLEIVGAAQGTSIANDTGSLTAALANGRFTILANRADLTISSIVIS